MNSIRVSLGGRGSVAEIGGEVVSGIEIDEAGAVSRVSSAEMSPSGSSDGLSAREIEAVQQDQAEAAGILEVLRAVLVYKDAEDWESIVVLSEGRVHKMGATVEGLECEKWFAHGFMKLADRMHAEGKYEKAAELYSQALKVYDRFLDCAALSVQVDVKLGVCLVLVGQEKSQAGDWGSAAHVYIDALRRLNKNLDLVPEITNRARSGLGDAYIAIGSHQLSQGEVEEATDSFLKAELFFSSIKAPYVNMMYVNYRKGVVCAFLSSLMKDDESVAFLHKALGFFGKISSSVPYINDVRLKIGYCWEFMASMSEAKIAMLDEVDAKEKELDPLQAYSYALRAYKLASGAEELIGGVYLNRINYLKGLAEKRELAGENAKAVGFYERVIEEVRGLFNDGDVPADWIEYRNVIQGKIDELGGDESK